MKTLALALALAPLFVQTALAEEHKDGSIIGTDIALVTHDHSFQGTIGGWSAKGALDEGTGVSWIKLFNGKFESRAEFKWNDEKELGGAFVRDDGVSTTLKFVSFKKTAPQFEFSLDGAPLLVTVESDGIVNNHFQNPTYSAVVSGRDISFKLTGEACPNYSAHLIMMIFGASAQIAR